MLPCDHLSEYILSLSMLDFRNRMGIALSRNIYNANGRIIVTYLIKDVMKEVEHV